jgi:hypothetical protein
LRVCTWVWDMGIYCQERGRGKTRGAKEEGRSKTIGAKERGRSKTRRAKEIGKATRSKARGEPRVREYVMGGRRSIQVHQRGGIEGSMGCRHVFKMGLVLLH